MTNPLPPRLGVRPFPGEPLVRRWTAQSWSAIAADVMRRAPHDAPRPVILGVDGRSGSGKTTVAERLAREVSGAVVVHTDDIAWWESFFGWDGVLAAELLLPVRRGGAVSYRPPAWQKRGRGGSIDVPAGTALLIVEGVGSTRIGLRGLLDVTLWVQSDADEAQRRGQIRDGSTDEAVAFWAEWQAEERPFLDADRPWDRADIIVCGTPELVAAADVDWPVPRPLSVPALDHDQQVLRGSLEAPWSPQTACRC